MFWTVITLACLGGELVFAADYIYVNRYRPEFTRNTYVAEVSENTHVGSAVTRVEARDGDVGSSLIYSIARGNEDYAFDIDSKTGSIKTRKKLDYEKKSNYNLRINVNDGFYDAKSFVEIKILKAETGEAVSQKWYQEIEVPEKSPTPKCVANVTAYGPDLPQHEPHLFVYSLIKNQDVEQFFEIDGSGCLIYKKPHVCNPDPKFWRVFVHVQDKSAGFNVAEIRVKIRCEVDSRRVN